MVLNPANPTVITSPAGWQLILTQLEAELHQSEAYCRAMTSLQAVLGETTEEVQRLVRAVGREAIQLVLRQMAQPVAELHVAPSLVPDPTSPELPANPIESSHSPEPETPNPDPGSEPAEKWQGFLSTGKRPSPESVLQLRLEERKVCLQQVGQELQAARQAKGLSLQLLHARTHIPIYKLEALEAGQVDDVSEDLFVRGFIRRISPILGVESDRLIAKIPTLDPMEFIAPSKPQTGSSIHLSLHPAHLYLGYAALIAGATGSLMYLSQDTTPPSAATVESALPSQTFVSPSHRVSTPVSPATTNMSPPEML